jgi:hypothetical protein
MERWSTGTPHTKMRRFWRGLGRTIFWSYERGSWPYDVMVIAIVAFVLLTPRKWFHDRPQSEAAAAKAGVQLVSRSSDGETRTYRLDAHMLPTEKRAAKATPELERETHDILGRAVDDLRDERFHVTQIDPTSGSDGSVLWYYVTIKP